MSTKLTCNKLLNFMQQKTQIFAVLITAIILATFTGLVFTMTVAVVAFMAWGGYKTVQHFNDLMNDLRD